MNEEMQKTLVERNRKENNYWAEIVKSGRRYDGAEDEFKKLRYENTIFLHELLQANDWPAISEYGEEVNSAACKIAIKSTESPKKMRFFYKQLTESVEQSESNPVSQAALGDCIKYYEGKKQKYGLCLEWHENGNLYANVEDVEQANTLRKALGIESIEEAIQAHLQELGSNPGGKPQDIVQHNNMHRKWAASVGWGDA